MNPTLRPFLLLALLVLALPAAEAHGQVFTIDYGPETVTAECPLSDDKTEQSNCACTQGETTAPCTPHVYEIIRLFTRDGTAWTLAHDDLLLPEGGVALEFAADANGRPIISYPIGGGFKPPRPQPHFATTQKDKMKLAFTIGYEQGAVALVCRLPDEAEAEELDCSCTQAGETVSCTLRRKRKRRR